MREKKAGIVVLRDKAIQYFNRSLKNARENAIRQVFFLLYKHFEIEETDNCECSKILYSINFKEGFVDDSKASQYEHYFINIPISVLPNVSERISVDDANSNKKDIIKSLQSNFLRLTVDLEYPMHVLNHAQGKKRGRGDDAAPGTEGAHERSPIPLARLHKMWPGMQISEIRGVIPDYKPDMTHIVVRKVSLHELATQILTEFCFTSDVLATLRISVNAIRAVHVLTIGLCGVLRKGLGETVMDIENDCRGNAAAGVADPKKNEISILYTQATDQRAIAGLAKSCLQMGNSDFVVDKLGQLYDNGTWKPNVTATDDVPAAHDDDSDDDLDFEVGSVDKFFV